MEVVNTISEQKEIENALGKLDLSNFLIDAHLHFQYFTDEEVRSIIEKCYENSEIKYFLTNATCFDDFDKTIKLSEFKMEDKVLKSYEDFDQNQIIFPGIGHHPWYLEHLADDWLEILEKKIVDLEAKKINFFIGEVGIDGGRPKKKVPLDKQIEILLKQMELAEKYDKLVTIHCVYEWEKLFKAIDNMKNKENLVKNSKIILHSFQGNCKIMEKFKKFNPWFSLSAGCFNEKNFDVIKKIPLENMILESDSPSMFNNLVYDDDNKYNYYFKEENGKFKNHPISIIDLGLKIAELKEISYVTFMDQIKINSKRIIKLVKRF